MYAPQGGSRCVSRPWPGKEILQKKHTRVVVEGVARVQKFVVDSERKLLGERVLLIDRPSIVLSTIP